MIDVVSPILRLRSQGLGLRSTIANKYIVVLKLETMILLDAVIARLALGDNAIYHPEKVDCFSTFLRCMTVAAILGPLL